MLAALNHPNICAIYGFEEADGIRFLILELVEGTTLADTLAQRSSSHAKDAALPLDRALSIARQIADALEVAHDKGIIHRDLKPANIKITPDGSVKVLDFGLAKAVDGDGSSPALTHAPAATSSEVPHGAVIGTAAYMSPEQARGMPVDRRTDIWAFGCVVYEMLTGRVAFAGETVSDSIAKILEREPEWSALPATTPASIRRLLLRCLAKDPKKRLRDIADVRIEIDAVEEVLPGGVLTPAPLRQRSGARAVAAVGGARGTGRGGRSLGGPSARSFREPTALRGFQTPDRLGWLRRPRRNLARRKSRRLHRRSRWRARFLFDSAGHRASNNLTSQLGPRIPSRSCDGPAFLPIRPDCGSTSCRAQKMEMPWSPGGTPRNFLVARRSYPGLVDRMTVSCISTIRIDDASVARGRRGQKRPEDPHRLGGRSERSPTSQTQSQHGVVTRQRVDLLCQRQRARLEPPEQRNGHLADSTLGRNAGATDLPEHLLDVPGDAGSGHARLHRARAGWVRIVALVAGCREPPNVENVGPKGGESTGDPAADPDGHRPIHDGLRQPRPRAAGRHEGEPHRHALAGADSRQQTSRRERRRAVPGSDRTGAVAALRAPS